MSGTMPQRISMTEKRVPGAAMRISAPAMICSPPPNATPCTAAITGSWVALHDCLKWMEARSMFKSWPLKDHVAAISCGLHGGAAVIDLDYAEDSTAGTDANFVMTGAGGIVEVQATAERAPFDRDALDGLLDLAESGVATIRDAQEAALDAAP